MIKQKLPSVAQLLKTNPLTEDELERRLEQLKSSMAARGILDFAKFVEVFALAIARHSQLQFTETQFAEVRKKLGEKIEKRDFRKYFGIVNKNHFALIDVDAEIAQREKEEQQRAIWAEENRIARERRIKAREQEAARSLEAIARPNFLSEAAKSFVHPTETPRPRLDYNDYLQSDQWKLIRRLVLERDKWHCRTCGARTNLQVHHWTYERIGNENLDDLTVLCAECHELISKNVKLKRA